MKLFVKQDGGFRLLGEGTISNKEKFVLKEFEATTDATNIDSVVKAAQSNSHIPGATGTQIEAGQIDNKTENGEGMTAQFKAPGGNVTADQKNQMRKVAQQNPDTKIQIDTATDQTNESKILSKRLIEMKRNAVPFTKKELTKYFKNM